MVAAAAAAVRAASQAPVPVVAALNCAHSVGLYAPGLDAVLVDPYPIGVDTDGCTPSFGCCGCDDCEGSVMDVVARVDTARAEAGGRPVWLVAQVRAVKGRDGGVRVCVARDV